LAIKKIRKKEETILNIFIYVFVATYFNHFMIMGVPSERFLIHALNVKDK
jgi:hypothetical protein